MKDPFTMYKVFRRDCLHGLTVRVRPLRFRLRTRHPAPAKGLPAAGNSGQLPLALVRGRQKGVLRARSADVAAGAGKISLVPPRPPGRDCHADSTPASTAARAVRRQSHEIFPHRRRRVYRQQPDGPAPGRKATRSSAGTILSTGPTSAFLEGAQERQPGFRLVRGDNLDLPALTAAMAGCEFVFHFAANADVRFGLEHPGKDLQQNTVATFHILEAMRANGIKGIGFSVRRAACTVRPP